MTMSFRTPSRAPAIARATSPMRSLEERVGVLAFALLLLVAMTHSLWAHSFRIGDIEIGHPWSPTTPQAAKVAAGYLVIKNNGSTPDRLVSVTAEISGKAEIHEMAVDANGVMTMRQLADGIEIPAGGEIALKPGGMHMMFFDLKRPSKEGEHFSGTLTFEKAGTVTVEFSVEAMGGKKNGHGD